MRLDDGLPRKLGRAIGKLRGIRGNLDGHIDGALVGWAAGRGPEPLRVGAYTARGLIAEASANIHRGDLAAAGIGTGHHGFFIRLDAVARRAIRDSGGMVEVRTLDRPRVALGQIRLYPARGGRVPRGGTGADDPLRQHLYGAVRHLGGLLASAAEEGAQAEPPPLRAHGLLFSRQDLLHGGDLPAPMTAYADYVRYRYKLDRSYDVNGNPGEVAHFLNWYISGYSTVRAGLRVPMSAEMIAWCNEPMIIGGQRNAILTRITWQFLINVSPILRSMDFSDPEWLDWVVYWWAIDQAHAMHVEDCLVPDSYVALLSAVPEEWKNQSLAPSAFMLRLHAHTEALMQIDLDGIEGRRRLALVILSMAGKRPDYLRYMPAATLDALLGEDGAEAPLAAFLREIGEKDLPAFTRADFARALARTGFDLETRRFAFLTPEGHRFEAAALPAVTGERVDVQIVGPFEKASGLGQATRLSAAAMAHAGLSVNCVDFDLDNPAPEGFSRVGELSGYRPARINLLHLNGESVPLSYAYQPDVLSGAYNIGYFFWELDTPAACHHLSLHLLDEIWVATDYGVSIFAPATDRPVTNVGMAVEEMPEIDRGEARAFVAERLGIGAQDFVFFVAFDSFSFVQRKNPLGTLRAFAEAFPDDPGVRLVIKTQNRKKVRDPAQMKIWDEVDRRVAADRRILLMDETLGYADLLKLKKGCDAYVSLHKSEGWGFGMIEAMNIGVPVLATAYSGNMDFCSGDTAWLVGYEEVELEPDEYIFVIPGQKWAEPDVADAARQMRALRADPAEAARRAQAAQDNVRRNFSHRAVGARYKARLDEILNGLKR